MVQPWPFLTGVEKPTRTPGGCSQTVHGRAQAVGCAPGEGLIRFRSVEMLAFTQVTTDLRGLGQRGACYEASWMR